MSYVSVCDCLLPDLESQVEAIVGSKRASTHSAMRYYRCRYCDYRSMKVLLVRDHIMTRHLNYRPFSCQSCDYTAIKGTYITQHIRLKHPDVSYEKYNSLYSRDETMESKLKNGYYVVSFSQSDVNEMSVKLQDHTYNSVTLAACTESASNLSVSHNNIQSRHTTFTANSPPRVIISPQKKKKFPDSDFRNGNLYQCCHCEYVADNRRSVNMHASKKHAKLVLDKSYDDLTTNISSNIDVGGLAASVDDSLTILSDHDHSNFTAPEKQVSFNEAADTNVSASHQLMSYESDIIYCCETCPCSFSTPEALSSHKCGPSMQQATM